MPYYRFRNKETNEEWIELMGISEGDRFLEEHPHIERLYNGAPLIGDPVRLGVRKLPESWRNHLKAMKKAHRGSTINDR